MIKQIPSINQKTYQKQNRNLSSPSKMNKVKSRKSPDIQLQSETYKLKNKFNNIIENKPKNQLQKQQSPMPFGTQLQNTKGYQLGLLNQQKYAQQYLKNHIIQKSSQNSNRNIDMMINQNNHDKFKLQNIQQNNLITVNNHAKNISQIYYQNKNLDKLPSTKQIQQKENGQKNNIISNSSNIFPSNQTPRQNQFNKTQQQIHQNLHLYKQTSQNHLLQQNIHSNELYLQNQPFLIIKNSNLQQIDRNLYPLSLKAKAQSQNTEIKNNTINNDNMQQIQEYNLIEISSPQKQLNQWKIKQVNNVNAQQVKNSVRSSTLYKNGAINTNNQNSGLLKFYVGKGNNAERIRQLFKKRPHWIECQDSLDRFINFKWQQTTKGYRYDKINQTNSCKQALNHFEYHTCISNKQYLLQNLMNYCKDKEIKIFDNLTPLTLIIDFNDPLCDTNIGVFLKIYKSNLPTQKQSTADTKKIMSFKKTVRQFMRTSIIEKKQTAYKKLKFNSAYISDKDKSSYLWLLKTTFLNRGRGIHVFSELDELEKLFTDYYHGFKEQPIGKNSQLKQKEKIDFVKLNKFSQMIKLNSEFQNNKAPNFNINKYTYTNENSNNKYNSVPNPDNIQSNLEQSKNQLQQSTKPSSQMSQYQQNISQLQQSQSVFEKKKSSSLQDLDQNQNQNQQQGMQIQQQQQQNSKQNQNDDKIPSQNKIETNQTNINNQQNRVQSYQQQKKLLQSNQDISSFNSEEQNIIQKLQIKNIKKQNPFNQNLAQNQIDNLENNEQISKQTKRTDYQYQEILKSTEFVIQKYIERPLLCKQKKFDIRVWVLVTQELDCYFFTQGYIRLSSEKYTVDNSQKNNIFVHLTNNAIQVNCENYGAEDEGNQMSFENFEKQVKIETDSNFNFMEQVYDQLKEKSMLSLKSVATKLNQNQRKNTFEIFGYDYILDEKYNAWLIEVNTNPAIEECSALLKMYIPRMLDDAFKLTLDVIFPQPKNLKQVNESNNQNNENQKQKEEQNIQKVFPVKGYSDDENLWIFMGRL